MNARSQARLNSARFLKSCPLSRRYAISQRVTLSRPVQQMWTRRASVFTPITPPNPSAAATCEPTTIAASAGATRRYRRPVGGLISYTRSSECSPTKSKAEDTSACSASSRTPNGWIATTCIKLHRGDQRTSLFCVAERRRWHRPVCGNALRVEVQRQRALGRDSPSSALAGAGEGERASRPYGRTLLVVR